MLFSCTDCSCVDADMTENMVALLKTFEVVLTTYNCNCFTYQKRAMIGKDD